MTTTSPATEMAALDAVAQAELVRCGEVTPAELVGWAIERIEDLNPILNAVIMPMYEQALAAAAMTPSTGRLAGVPYLVKDLIAEVACIPFSEGSRFLRGHVSHFDSELVLRLRRAGLVIVGKTNTPEFGMAPTCEPVLHGPTRNPWDTTRSTSGSSGGGYAAELGDEIIAVALDHGARLPSPMSQIHFHQMGGAAGRAGTEASAFSGRAAGHTYTLISTWTDPAQDATHIDANRTLAASLAPHSMGGTYVNFTTETDSSRVRAAYDDEIYDRLGRLKRHYDLANLFCRNQNIRPAQ